MNTGSDTATFLPLLRKNGYIWIILSHLHCQNVQKKSVYSVGVHQKDLPTLLNLYLGFWPSTTQHWSSAATAFMFLLAKILETIGNLGCILQQMGDVEGFICLVMVSGWEFTEMERMLLSFTSACACLPAWRGVWEGGMHSLGKGSFIILFAVRGHKQELCFQVTFTQLVTYSETLICLCTFERQCQSDSRNAQRKVMGKLRDSSCSPKCKWLPDASGALAWILQNLMWIKWCYLCCCSTSFGVKCNSENGFKISYFVKFSIFVEPARFLHLFFILSMRHGTQTDFLSNSCTFLLCFNLLC